MTPATRLRYLDGSANEFRFEEETPGGDVVFTYVPVTPEVSSSGTYSGGPPRHERIPAGDPRLAELWRRVDALAADPALRAPSRMMGTGAFRIVRSGETRELLIVRGPALAEWDRWLADFGAAR